MSSSLCQATLSGWISVPGPTGRLGMDRLRGQEEFGELGWCLKGLLCLSGVWRGWELANFAMENRGGEVGCRWLFIRCF